MHKYLILLLGLTAFLTACDKPEFEVKGFKEAEHSPIININVEAHDTIVTLDIESSIKDWYLTKEKPQEDYWSFSDVISNNVSKIEGSGDKLVNIYLKPNTNSSEVASHIMVHYGGQSKKMIQIIQGRQR